MDNLTGHLVLVHPNLTKDPAHHQGEVGIITSTDLAKDEIYVGFGTNQLGLYAADALLVLKPHQELYENILVNVKKMDTPDFKTLMEITILQERNSVNYLRDAMELAMTNEKTLSYSTISLQDKLDLARNKQQENDNTENIDRLPGFKWMR